MPTAECGAWGCSLVGARGWQQWGWQWCDFCANRGAWCCSPTGPNAQQQQGQQWWCEVVPSRGGSGVELCTPTVSTYASPMPPLPYPQGHQEITWLPLVFLAQDFFELQIFEQQKPYFCLFLVFFVSRSCGVLMMPVNIFQTSISVCFNCILLPMALVELWNI